jgi:hypothetical protein
VNPALHLINASKNKKSVPADRRCCPFTAALCFPSHTTKSVSECCSIVSERTVNHNAAAFISWDFVVNISP